MRATIKSLSLIYLYDDYYFTIQLLQGGGSTEIMACTDKHGIAV